LLTALSINPHASCSDVAQSDGQEHSAVSVALTSAVVPLAFWIGIALRLSVEVNAAFDDALVVVVELAHGVSLADLVAHQVASLAANS
jgi:hypothetical protein